MILDYLTVGMKIRNLRKRKKLTQEKLAELVDITPSYLSYIEKGFKCPSLEKLIAFSNALDTTPDFLLAECLTSKKNALVEIVFDILGDCSVEECTVLLESLQTLKENIRKLGTHS